MNKGHWLQYVESAKKNVLALVLGTNARLPISPDQVECDRLTQFAYAPPFDVKAALYASFPYREPLVHDLLWSLKYHNQPRVADLFAPSLAGSAHIITSDWPHLTIVPIPLSDERRRERGYNQAEWLALALQTQLPLAGVDTELLLKADRVPQTTLSRTQRLNNMQGAFSVASGRSVRGKYILLVDDIITTGATLSAARKTLLNAGAIEVKGLAVAH